MNKKEIKEIKAKILNKIGDNVNFIYPIGEGKKQGILKDRFVQEPELSEKGIPYFNVIDLIEFQNVKEKTWIRIGYYRWKYNRLIWGSQTTITETPETLIKLFNQASKEKKWFKKITDNV